MSESFLIREFAGWLLSGLSSACSAVFSFITCPSFVGFVLLGVCPSAAFLWLGFYSDSHNVESNYPYVIAFCGFFGSLVLGFLYAVWRCEYGT